MEKTWQEKVTGYPSIDKPWLKYYSEKAINSQLPNCTVYKNIFQHNKNHLEQTALEYFGKRICYKKMFEQVDSCARALKLNGIAKGSIVTVCSTGIPEIVYLMLACSKIGAIVNFVNPFFETQQIIERINDTHSDILFVMDRMYSLVEDVVDKTHIKKVVIIPVANSLHIVRRTVSAWNPQMVKSMKKACKTEKYVFWNAYIKCGSIDHGGTDAHYEKDMPMIMVYSSGTTGASKGIVLTNDGINATISQYEASLHLGKLRGYRFLHSLPVWFSTGVVISLLMPLCMGVSCILVPVFNPDTFWNDIIKYKPNFMLTGSSIFQYDMNNKAIDNLSFIICPITGGERLTSYDEEEINLFLKKRGCNAKLQKGWGMCELGATVATTVFLNAENKHDSVGIPMPLVVVSAFDVDTGKELPCGERGELRVITPCRMKEYYRNLEATEAFFRMDETGNVWGCTGDIGYVDKDGFVFVLGRKSSHFFAPDGNRYYLFDIENVILENPFVSQCVAVTLKSVIAGREIPVVHAILSPKFSGDVDELILDIDRMCRERLSEYAVPAGYKIRDNFVISASGKRDTLSLKSERDNFMIVSAGKVAAGAIV